MCLRHDDVRGGLKPTSCTSIPSVAATCRHWWEKLVKKAGESCGANQVPWTSDQSDENKRFVLPKEAPLANV